MITGVTIGIGTAQTAAGLPTPYQIVTPEKTVANLAQLAAEGKRWREAIAEFERLALTAKLDPQVAKRARFAEEVLATVGNNVLLGVCCQLLVQDYASRVLGVATYGHWDSFEQGQRTRSGAINLQAIDPRHLAGTPGTQQLRGIGTAMTAAISRQMLARGVSAVYLHPLDQAAYEFWSRRGFGICGRGGLLCIRGRTGIEALIDGCHLQPDGPDRGDVVVCGRPGATVGQRVPVGIMETQATQRGAVT